MEGDDAVVDETSGEGLLVVAALVVGLVVPCEGIALNGRELVPDGIFAASEAPVGRYFAGGAFVFR